ncbi:MAG: aminopeptidase [Lachnospiraceae bacterium]|nr:aminopeptidase [Lachnospiraceae bacterium]
MNERFELSINRIQEIALEEGMMEYQPFFTSLAKTVCDFAKRQNDNPDEEKKPAVEELLAKQDELFGQLKAENYEMSFANPSYTCSLFGDEIGRLLSFLYWEEMQVLPLLYEGNEEEFVIHMELFLEVYGYFRTCTEEKAKPNAETLKEILYWFVSDYSEDVMHKRMEEQFVTGNELAMDIVMNADLNNPSYLFRYGEYVSDSEIATAKFLSTLPEEKIDKMADTFTEGFRKGFVAAGKDLSIKNTVNIRYMLGFERVVRKAVENFEKMGLRSLLFRAGGDIFRKRGLIKIGYTGGSLNRQAEYDHREDLSLFLDGHLVTRKLECLKAAYEAYKDEVRGFAGPACLETFGESDFTPVEKEACARFDEKGRKRSLEYTAKAGEMANTYIHREERSFTIIAFPVPEIGDCFEELFEETIRINTLDATLYATIQGRLIDALNRAERVHILGKDGNKTDLIVELCKLDNMEKETKFENCVADVNIPVGEVFTSPVLEGTNGLLHVKKVYINGLLYENLSIRVKDGMTTEYSVSNMEKNVIEENILFHYDSLPMGEFAIGTNTTAYSVAKRMDIFDKFPILIAEKMGPHFAFGDTCYSEEEEVRVYNPDGKEIVAKENSVSAKRKEDPLKAYFHCHTDITIPYEEIGLIEAITESGEAIPLIRDGRFVLPGTEELNLPLDA